MLKSISTKNNKISKLLTLSFIIAIAALLQTTNTMFANGGTNLLFPRGASKLSNANKLYIRSIVSTLPKNDTIVVIGWADTTKISPKFDNQKLANQRADEVKKFLSQNGIPAAFIVSTGKVVADTNLPTEYQRKCDIMVTGTAILTMDANQIATEQVFERKRKEIAIIDREIPANIQKKLRDAGFELNKGAEPPKVAPGPYVYLPELKEDSKCNYCYDHFTKWQVKYMKFNTSDTGTIDVAQVQGDSLKLTSLGKDGYIMGQNKDFMIYVIAIMDFGGVKYKTANIYKGSVVNNSGIENFEYAFVVLDKEGIETQEGMEVGDIRIFKSYNENQDDKSSFVEKLTEDVFVYNYRLCDGGKNSKFHYGITPLIAAKLANRMQENYEQKIYISQLEQLKPSTLLVNKVDLNR